MVVPVPAVLIPAKIKICIPVWKNAGFSTNPTLKAFYEGSQSGSARSAQLQRSGQRQQPAHRHS